MHRTVTVGLDGSPASLAAADWAAGEARRRGLPLRLLRVREQRAHPAVPLVGPVTRGAASARMPGEVVADLRRRHPDLEIAADQVDGRPAVLLAAAAQEADLLVLGSRGRSGFAGALLGSVSLATVSRVRRPVVLVRADRHAEHEHRADPAGHESTATRYRDVVVGLELPRASEELLEFAFDAAARRGATLRVVHGWTPPSRYEADPAVEPHPDRDVEQTRAEVRQLAAVLRPWRAKFPEVQVVERVLAGRPEHHLVDASADACLLVVGRRVRHAPVGGRFGPVAHAVLHHAHVPVAVVAYA